MAFWDDLRDEMNPELRMKLKQKHLTMDEYKVIKRVSEQVPDREQFKRLVPLIKESFFINRLSKLPPDTYAQIGDSFDGDLGKAARKMDAITKLQQTYAKLYHMRDVARRPPDSDELFGWMTTTSPDGKSVEYSWARRQPSFDYDPSNPMEAIGAVWSELTDAFSNPNTQLRYAIPVLENNAASSAVKGLIRPIADRIAPGEQLSVAVPVFGKNEAGEFGVEWVRAVDLYSKLGVDPGDVTPGIGAMPELFAGGVNVASYIGAWGGIEASAASYITRAIPNYASLARVLTMSGTGAAQFGLQVYGAGGESDDVAKATLAGALLGAGTEFGIVSLERVAKGVFTPKDFKPQAPMVVGSGLKSRVMNMTNKYWGQPLDNLASFVQNRLLWREPRLPAEVAYIRDELKMSQYMTQGQVAQSMRELMPLVPREGNTAFREAVNSYLSVADDSGYDLARMFDSIAGISGKKIKVGKKEWMLDDYLADRVVNLKKGVLNKRSEKAMQSLVDMSEDSRDSLADAYHSIIDDNLRSVMVQDDATVKSWFMRRALSFGEHDDAYWLEQMKPNFKGDATLRLPDGTSVSPERYVLERLKAHDALLESIGRNDEQAKALLDRDSGEFFYNAYLHSELQRAKQRPEWFKRLLKPKKPGGIAPIKGDEFKYETTKTYNIYGKDGKVQFRYRDDLMGQDEAYHEFHRMTGDIDEMAVRYGNEPWNNIWETEAAQTYKFRVQTEIDTGKSPVRVSRGETSEDLSLPENPKALPSPYSAMPAGETPQLFKRPMLAEADTSFTSQRPSSQAYIPSAKGRITKLFKGEPQADSLASQVKRPRFVESHGALGEVPGAESVNVAPGSVARSESLVPKYRQVTLDISQEKWWDIPNKRRKAPVSVEWIDDAGKRRVESFDSGDKAKKFILGKVGEYRQAQGYALKEPLREAGMRALGLETDPLRRSHLGWLETEMDIQKAEAYRVMSYDERVLSFDELHELIKVGGVKLQQKDIEWYERLIELGRKEGKPYEAYSTAVEGGTEYVAVPKNYKRYGALADRWIPKDWLDEIDDIADFDFGSLEEAVRVGRGIMRAVKGNMTFRNLATHMNQFFGNPKYAMAASVSPYNPKWWKLYAESAKDIVTGSPEYRDMVTKRLLQDYIRSGGEVTFDAKESAVIAEIFQDMFSKVQLPLDASPFQRYYAFTREILRRGGETDRLMAAMYQLEDNVYKMTAVKAYRQKGWTDADIKAKIIDKYYPNYDRYNKFWQGMSQAGVLSPFSPFIRFSLEDLRISLWMLKDKPYVLAAWYGIPRLANEISKRVAGMDKEEMSEMDKHASKYRVNTMFSLLIPQRDENGFWQVRYNTWSPGSDMWTWQWDEDRTKIENVLRMPVSRFTPLDNPFVNISLSLATNRDWFTGKPIANRDLGGWRQATQQAQYVGERIAPPLLGRKARMLWEAAKQDVISKPKYQFKDPVTGKTYTKEWSVRRNVYAEGLKAVTGLSLERVEPLVDAYQRYDALAQRYSRKDTLAVRELEMNGETNDYKKYVADMNELNLAMEETTRWVYHLLLPPEHGGMGFQDLPEQDDMMREMLRNKVKMETGRKVTP